MEPKIQIIVGTSEEYVLGYELNIEEDGKIHLKEIFAVHSHTASVRQVAIGGNFLVSGGADEHIKVYNLKKLVEVGTLTEHEGTINSLTFHKNKYLFSGSEDGKICIFSPKEWRCEKTLKGHKAGVVSVSVHPSGKLALSVSRDKKLHTWNLIKGRKAYITPLDKTPDIIQWSPTGSLYLIVKGSRVDVYDVATCKAIHTVDFKEQVSALEFLTDDIIAIAAGDKNICLYDITHHFEILQWQAHDLRVKSIRLLPRDDAEEPWLITSSSDGFIKLWKLQLLSLTSKPELLGEVNTTCRIICMDVYRPLKEESELERNAIVTTGKRKKKKRVVSVKENGNAKVKTIKKKKKKHHVPVEENALGTENTATQEKIKTKKKKKSVTPPGEKKSVLEENVDKTALKKKKKKSVVSVKEKAFEGIENSARKGKMKMKKKRTQSDASAHDDSVVPKKKKMKI